MKLKNLVSMPGGWLRKPVNSGAYRPWLMERGSLTRKLQQASKHFAVRPARFVNSKPLPDEARLLKLKPWQKTWVREVYLDCNHKPTVFAHSVLPVDSLRGSWLNLGRLGNRSLGSALFSNPLVRRTPLAFRKLSRQHPLYYKAALQLQSPPPELWARRSVFYLGSSAILVTEIFLPQVLVL
ncbi:MAG TPA: chorismate lyase [Methylophilaceae bacterium]|nr:chorismate lyase [Methylophilaceae bacterium]